MPLSTSVSDMERNVSVNTGDGAHLIRAVTAADSGAMLPGLDPGSLEGTAFRAALLASANWGRVLYTKRLSNIRLRFFAGGAADNGFGKTVGITIISSPHPSSDQRPDLADRITPAMGKSRVVAKGILTFKGSRTALKCPVTGAVSTYNWYEASEFDVSPGFLDDSAVRLHPTDSVVASATSEVQKITLVNASGGESYTVDYNGSEASAGIPWDSLASVVEAALVGLSTIGAGGCTVARGGVTPNWEYTITFAGALGVAGNLPMIETAVLSGDLQANVTELTPGVEGFQKYITLDAEGDQQLHIQVDSIGSTAFRCGAECVS
jgi:hypothetical protein